MHQLGNALKDDARDRRVVRAGDQHARLARRGEVARHDRAGVRLGLQVAPQGLLALRAVKQPHALHAVLRDRIAGDKVAQAVQLEDQMKWIGPHRVKLGGHLDGQGPLDDGQRRHAEAAGIVRRHEQLRRLAAVHLLKERSRGKHVVRAAIQILALQRVDALARRKHLDGTPAHQLESIVTGAHQLHGDAGITVNDRHLARRSRLWPGGRIERHGPAQQQLQQLVDLGRGQAQLLAHRKRRPRRGKHAAVHAVSRIRPTVAHTPTHKAHQLAILVRKGVEVMRERKALAILVVHALGDQALERT